MGSLRADGRISSPCIPQEKRHAVPSFWAVLTALNNHAATPGPMLTALLLRTEMAAVEEFPLVRKRLNGG